MSFRNDGTRPGAEDGVSPPLAPSQGCEQETTTAETTEQRHEAGRWGWSLPSSRSQSGMRAGDDDRRDDGATARGRALGMESPLLSLPVRDASRRRRPQRQRSDGTRPGAGDGVSPPLAPSQGCEQETTTAETTERRHEAGRWGWSLPSSRSQSGMRAGDDDRRDNGATARGRALRMESPLLSLLVRDASRRRRPQRRRSDGTRPGAVDGVSPPLAPSQGCEQGTTMAVPRGYEGNEQIRSVLGRADPEQGPP